MQFFDDISLRRKQRLIIMLTCTVALLLACAAFIVYDAISFRTHLTGRIVNLAEITAANCSAAADFNDVNGATETLSALRVEPEILVACVYDRDGHMLAIYRR